MRSSTRSPTPEPTRRPEKHRAAPGHCAFEIERREHNAGRAVRDEADDTAEQLADHGAVEHERAERFRPDSLHQKIQNERHNEEKHEDLERMAQRWI